MGRAACHLFVSAACCPRTGLWGGGRPARNRLPVLPLVEPVIMPNEAPPAPRSCSCCSWDHSEN